MWGSRSGYLAMSASTKKQAALYAGLSAAIVILLLASGVALRLIQSRVETSELNALRAVLNTTQTALRTWAGDNQENAAIWAQHLEVRQAALELLDVPRNRDALVSHSAQQDLREQLEGIVEIFGHQGFFVIARDGTNLASSRDSKIGLQTVLSAQSGFLEKVWHGDTAISTPQPSQVPLPNAEGKREAGVPTMFVGAPIFSDSGEVVAAFTFRLDPYHGFIPILREGRFGESGETYAINANGLLISESRYEGQLRDSGLLKSGQSSAFGILMHAPDDIDEQSLMKAAAHTIEFGDGSSMSPYSDYRGEPVIGAWKWDDQLDIGLITETDAIEAFSSFAAARNIIVLLTLFLVSALVAAAIAFSRYRLRIKESERRFRGIAENIPGLVFQLTRSTEGSYRYGYISGDIKAQIGVDPESLPTNPAMKGRGTHPDDREARQAELEASAKNLSPVDFEFRTNPENGPVRSLRMLSTPRSLPSGEIMWDGIYIEVTAQKEAESALTNTLDELELRIAARTNELWKTNQSMQHEVTERKKAEGAAMLAKETALAASRSKSEFLANMSHDLRTPLNAILGFAQMIRDKSHGSDATERYADYASDIHQSGALLLEIINDILDLSKLEAGKMEISEGRFDPVEITVGALNMVQIRADQAKLTLAPPSLPEGVLLLGDERKLKQAVINLIANAVKFTPEGGTISVEARLSDADEYVLSVQDTGVGIAEKDLRKVMRPFGQVGNPMVHSGQGTGLGLPIVQAIAELHGGKFTLESTLGEGTTASIILPADRIFSSDHGTEGAPSDSPLDIIENEVEIEVEEGPVRISESITGGA